MNGLSIALSFIFSAVFVLSLYIMDRMTKKANGKKRGELISKLKELKDKLESDEAKTRLELEIVSLASEPAGVLDKREIRRALAISITVAYFTMLSFAIFNKLANTEVISEFSKVFLVVIAFYFGSRAIEDAIKLKKGQVSQPAQTTQAQPQKQETKQKEDEKKGGGER